MTTKRILLTGILCLLIGNIFATDKNIDKKNIDKKACKYVQERLNTIEEFHNSDVGFSFELVNASEFLASITELESDYLYSYEAIGATVNTDAITAWKNWFEANKHLLYWDDELKTVRVKTEE